MPHKVYFSIKANSREAAILRAASMALSEMADGGTTRCTSFTRLVHQYTGKHYSLDEIQKVLDIPISQYVVDLDDAK